MNYRLIYLAVFLASKLAGVVSWDFRGMEGMMFRASSNNEVFNPIIVFNSVDMVDCFTCFKKTSEVFFHYQTVFTNIFLAICKRMFRIFNENIARARVEDTTTFPIWVMVFCMIVFSCHGIKYI